MTETTMKMTMGDWLRAHADFDGNVCLIWPWFCHPTGYPQLGVVGDGSHTKCMYAHRYMCELRHGPAPSPKHQAAHSCNNRRCVNPKHLDWKTNAGNQSDRKRHKPIYPGRKLTPKQHDEIRALKGKMTQREIARQYGVTFQNVSLIHRNASH